MNSRLIVYGDIHGCFNEFSLLRKKIKIKETDIEVSVGDFLTKGGSSLKTLNFIQKNKILSVLGNHEDKLVRYIKHRDQSYENPILLDEDEKLIVEKLNAKNIAFLCNLPLYLKFGPITVLHGGVLNFQKLDEISTEDRGKILRLRYVDIDGKFLPNGTEDKSSLFWADIYDGNEGFVVYGHQTFNEANKSTNAIGIDTGCFYGNKLSAIVFSNLVK